MARDERMKHMQLYPGWSARDNYGARKKRGNKGKKREKSQGENGGNLNYFFKLIKVCWILFRMS